MGVSKNKGTPKWMVYNGKPYENGWFGGTAIFGNIQIFQVKPGYVMSETLATAPAKEVSFTITALVLHHPAVAHEMTAPKRFADIFWSFEIVSMQWETLVRGTCAYQVFYV